MLKRSYVDNRPLALLEVGSGGQMIWSLTGWQPWSDMSWTGIGGDANWDEVDEEEARAAIVEMGGDPASLGSASDRIRAALDRMRE